MNLRAILIAHIILGLLAPGSAQTQNALQVVKLDPALNDIVPVGAKIERVANGFSFVEGPVWSHQGYLLFSDIPQNVIRKWSSKDGLSIFLKDSGYAGPMPRPVPKELTLNNLLGYLIGSNGLTFDHEGRLIICEHGNRRVERLERDGSRTIIADRFEGKRLNSPNDVVVKSDGSIYFTDPPFGLQSTHSQPEVGFGGVYRVKDGKIELITKELKGPNGIAFSPDEKYLYLDDSIDKLYVRYDVKSDGTIANKRLFFDAANIAGVGVPDGIKVDQKGNVYACGPGGVRIFTPTGKVLGMFKFPVDPSNLAWGGDGKTLYVASWTSIYRIRLAVQGIYP